MIAWTENDGEMMYTVQDHLGSPMLTVDGKGNVTAKHSFTAFGASTTDNPVAFNGKLLDEETGLVYYGFRFFDTDMGRWLTPDPLGYTDGPNIYAYCGNDPVNNVDPLGLFEEGMSVDRWNKMSEQDRLSFFNKFYQQYGKYISSSSLKNNIPPRVLAALIISEQIDYSFFERNFEIYKAEFGYNTSLGLGQILISTAINHHLVPFNQISKEFYLGKEFSSYSRWQVINKLKQPEYNIEAVAKYINVIIGLAKKGQMLGKNSGRYKDLYDFSKFNLTTGSWNGVVVDPAFRKAISKGLLNEESIIMQILGAAYTSPPFYNPSDPTDEGWGCMTKGFKEYNNWGGFVRSIYDELTKGGYY